MRAPAASFLLPLSLASPGCALLYDFEDTGGAASTASATSGQGGSGSGGAGGAASKSSFLLDQCLVFGDEGADVPSRSAIAISGNSLYFTGTFEPSATSDYLGVPLMPPEQAAKATVLGVFDAGNLEAIDFRSTAHTDTIPPSFVRSDTNTDVLFGGSFAGMADLYFEGDAVNEAIGVDAFLNKLSGNLFEPAAAPWEPPIWTNEEGLQSVVAAAENGRHDVFVLGAATQIAALDGCDAVDTQAAPFAYLRWMNEPEVSCLAQRSFEVGGDLPFDVTLTRQQGLPRDHVYLSLQSASANAAWGRVVGYEASYDLGTLTQIVPTSGPADAHFQTRGLGRIRLAPDALGGVFTCANQEECPGGTCTDATRKPGAIEIGRLDVDGYQPLITTERIDRGSIGCDSIVVLDGGVVFGGSVDGQVALTLGDETLSVRSAAAGDTDAFLVRFTPDGARFEQRVFGGAGDQRVVTLARDPARPSTKEIVVAGSTNGIMSAPECGGSIGATDVFLMRMTVLDQSGDQRN